MGIQKKPESFGMKLLLTDVSVFFDLFELNLLLEFFGMEWEIYTTDVVYDEIEYQSQQDEFSQWVRSKQLKVLELEVEELEEMQKMKTHLKNRSIADKSLLWKAKEMNIPLLTCDAKLRKEANYQDLEVHGSIWVIEKMNYKGVIFKEEAISKLKLLKSINNRLPENRIDDLIKKLK